MESNKSRSRKHFSISNPVTYVPAKVQLGPSKKLIKDVRGVSLLNEITRCLLSVGADLCLVLVAISVIRNEPQALTPLLRVRAAQRYWRR